jgi:hypothetical protein
LVRFRGRNLALVVAICGATLSTLSGGAGLAAWPAIALAMALLGYKNPISYLRLALAAVVASTPYIYFHVFAAGQWLPMWRRLNLLPPRSHIAPDLPFTVASIGYPFAQHFSPRAVLVAGFMGIALAVTFVAFIWRARRSRWRYQTAPSAALVVYGFCTIWLIGSNRGQLAPWYPAHFMPIWIGFVGLAYCAWYNRPRRFVLWPATVLGIVATLFATSNLTYADKVYYLYYHSPASAACLRSYRWAPGYCEQYLGGWPPGSGWSYMKSLGSFLDRRQLSVFAPDQTWTLQGDYVLPAVTVRSETLSDVFWSDGFDPSPTPWSSYRHLHLFVGRLNSVAWNFRLPEILRQATFATTVTLRGRTPHSSVRLTLSTNDITRSFVVQVSRTSGTPFSVNLFAYRGKDVRITLRGPSDAHTSYFVYQFPTVTTSGIGNSSDSTSPMAAVTTPTWGKSAVLSSASASWVRVPTPRQTVFALGLPAGQSGGLYARKYSGKLNLCLPQYRNVVLQVQERASAWPRALVVFTYLRNPTLRGVHIVPFFLPLLPGSRARTYRYDLKLLMPRMGDRLVDLSYASPGYAGHDNLDAVKVGAVRFTGSLFGSGCSSPSTKPVPTS